MWHIRGRGVIGTIYLYYVWNILIDLTTQVTDFTQTWIRVDLLEFWNR